jgi:hypothetical protein
MTAGAPEAGPGAGRSPAEDGEALRAEHDRLAARLSVRRSIDSVRAGAYASFLLVVTGGLAAKFAWDRWGWGVKPLRPVSRTPLLFLVALVLALACLAAAWVAFARARRTMREEDREFARLRTLRQKLGIES